MRSRVNEKIARGTSAKLEENCDKHWMCLWFPRIQVDMKCYRESEWSCKKTTKLDFPRLQRWTRLRSFYFWNIKMCDAPSPYRYRRIQEKQFLGWFNRLVVYVRNLLRVCLHISKAVHVSSLCFDVARAADKAYSRYATRRGTTCCSTEPGKARQPSCGVSHEWRWHARLSRDWHDYWLWLYFWNPLSPIELERLGNVINDRGNFAITLPSLSRVHCVEYANALADRKQLTCLSIVYRALSIVEPALSYRLLRKLSPKQLLTAPTVVSRFRESQRKIEKTRRTSFGDNSPPTCNAATSVGFDVDSTSNTCFPLNGSQRQPRIHIR